MVPLPASPGTLAIDVEARAATAPDRARFDVYLLEKVEAYEAYRSGTRGFRPERGCAYAFALCILLFCVFARNFSLSF